MNTPWWFSPIEGDLSGWRVQARDTLLRDLRCRGERGFALQHITADPGRTTEITRAAPVLTQFEHKYIS